jgi:uncharacterized oligopeptide transporter (OPT) family protein
MGAVAQGVFNSGLPKTIIGIGAAIAVVVIIIDTLQRSGSKIRVPVMAFAVGVYLPFRLNVPIFLGGVIGWLVSRALDRSNASPERRGEVERRGLLAAAGFITGEALLGIGLAVPVALRHDEDALALGLVDNGHGKLVPSYADFAPPALLFVALVMVLLYKLALRKDETRIPPA